METKKSENKERFRIKLSDDLLNAYLTIFPPLEGQEPVTLPEIKKALLKLGVTYGINVTRIIIAISENKSVFDLPIAQGKKPVQGKNAKLKYHFHEKGMKFKPKELDNGKVDFYNIGLIQNVKKGQLLLEKIPATNGIPGITITGKEIPCLDGKDVTLPIGKNIFISKDNSKGFAACDGHVVISNGKVSVLSVFEVNGDVDFSTGNIDFVGNVIIKGNIREGFTVKAVGDVEIYGTVEGGNVFAGGNILIKKGIRGINKSKIKTQGCVYSNFIEHANIEAREDVIVKEAIIHSIVNCGQTIQVGGRKGLVVGGICRAGKALICKNIGSNLGTLTNIEVGINPELRLTYDEISQTIKNNQETLDKTLKALKILKEIKEKNKMLPPDKQALEFRLLRTKEELFKKNEDLKLHFKMLEEQIKELEEGYIKVYSTINCGTNVKIGKANKHITNEINKVMLTQKGMDISIVPLID